MSRSPGSWKYRFSMVVIGAVAAVLFWNVTEAEKSSVRQEVGTVKEAAVITEAAPLDDAPAGPHTRLQHVNPESLLTELNKRRSAYGKAALVLDERLNTSAQEKCDDMHKNDYFAHANPRTGRQGYAIAEALMQDRQGFYAENLLFNNGSATGQPSRDGRVFDEKAIYDQWMGSRGHRENILASSYKATGFGICGYAEEDLGSWRIVQHFYGR